MSIYESMLKKLSVRSCQITLAMMTALLCLPSGARADPPTVTQTVSDEAQAAALAHWTREKIAAAPAMRLPVDKGLGRVDPADWEEKAVGPLGSAPAGMADPDSSRVARAFYEKDWATLDADLDQERELAPDAFSGGAILKGTSTVYSFYDVNTHASLWNIYPHVWMGKLTFTTASGGSSCSATAISGNNIVTAAHCVYDTTNNVFYNNWVFAPAFRNGSAPYGTFAAQACTILGAWVDLTGNFSIGTWSRHDVAVCTVGNNSAGKSLNASVGWAGRTWNAANTQLVFNSGYPARVYTDALIGNGPAQYLRSCTAETFLYTTETLASGCHWGRGISGGSWLIAYKPLVVSGHVISVNSGLFLNQRNIYGARFNTNNIVPLCNLRAC